MAIFLRRCCFPTLVCFLSAAILALVTEAKHSQYHPAPSGHYLSKATKLNETRADASHLFCPLQPAANRSWSDKRPVILADVGVKPRVRSELSTVELRAPPAFI